MAIPSHEKAQEFVDKVVPTFQEHVRWELTPGVMLPGNTNFTISLMNKALTFMTSSVMGMTAMDIGTVNGCGAFELERRGASAVFAVDIMPPDFFGFKQLHSLLSSKVTFLRVRCYELPAIFEPNSFDFVQFSGVMYHLRHPMLSVDAIYTLLKPGGIAAIETATAGSQYTHKPDFDVSKEDSDWIKFVDHFQFHVPDGSKQDDYTNWFFPSMVSLTRFFTSSGFEVLWTKDLGERGQLVVRKIAERDFLSHGYKVGDFVRPALMDPSAAAADPSKYRKFFFVPVAAGGCTALHLCDATSRLSCRLTAIGVG
eukprot:CAMPEP_0194485730 /NCGR_PEP_ID=MMETSP0253-20130528/6622_1 /TAXON_ID=2966 /ORGANISM="Noctiluca scintillans" /LENGTH=311 /DNA_ID=CAMNT_0039325733 /DNA_START=191 /DNA_END=1124 /DNA_ORIENTATION=+